MNVAAFGCNEATDLPILRAALQDRPSKKEALEQVAQLTKETPQELRVAGKKARAKSANRAFAMYACKHYSGATYKEIADYFNLTHLGSVCYPLSKVNKEIKDGLWKNSIVRLEKEFYIVKQTPNVI